MLHFITSVRKIICLYIVALLSQTSILASEISSEIQSAIADHGFYYSCSLLEDIKLPDDTLQKINNIYLYDTNEEPQYAHAFAKERIFLVNVSLSDKSVRTESEAGLPDFLSDVIFRLIGCLPEAPEQCFNVQMRIISEAASWLEKQESLAPDDSAVITFHDLFWHQDSRPSCEYDYLAFMVLDLQNVPHHLLQLGLADENKTFTLYEYDAAKVPDQDVDVIREESCKKGSGYIINEKFRKDNRLIVHKRSSFKLLITNSNEPDYLDDPSNMQSSSYKAPLRLKLVMRITKILRNNLQNEVILREIYHSISENNIEKLRELLSKTPEVVNWIDSEGCSLLQQISGGYDGKDKRLDAVRCLVEHGAKVNELGRSQYHRYTALHKAAFAGNVEIAKVLLAAGADPRIRHVSVSDGEKQETPLHSSKCPEFICLLLDSKKINVHEKDHEGRTVLDYLLEEYRRWNRRSPDLSQLGDNYLDRCLALVKPFFSDEQIKEALSKRGRRW